MSRFPLPPAHLNPYNINWDDIVQIDKFDERTRQLVTWTVKVVELNPLNDTYIAELKMEDGGKWYSAGSAPFSHLYKKVGALQRTPSGAPVYGGKKRKTRRNRKSRRN